MDTNTKALVTSAVKSTGTRTELWIELIKVLNVRSIVEVGVFRGDFAEAILSRCDGVEKYYMVDPWRNLDNWNKPANVDDTRFENFYNETMQKTEFAADRRVVLRGTTTEVIDQIPDGEIDLFYIDGDHTLRGIAIDLVASAPKVRSGGLLGGDDFCPSIWQHDPRFEPTLVAPFAAHFAEGLRCPFHALPHEQFLISDVNASETTGYEMVDHTGEFGDLTLKPQVDPIVQLTRGLRAVASTVKQRVKPVDSPYN